MKHLLLAIGGALLLAALLAPATIATGGSNTAAEPTSVAEPTVAPEPTPTPVENGEIVIDPTFIAPSPRPAGEVQGATGRPDATPPATDTRLATARPGAGLQVLVVLAIGGSFLALLVGRVPTVPRR